MGDIFSLSGQSYRDAWMLLQRATTTVAIAVAILAASSFISLGADRLIATSLGRQVAGTLCSVAGIWFASPYLVSLYRFLLNKETVPPESLRGTDAAQRFFGWSAVLAFVTAAPGFVFAAFAPPGLTPETADNPETILLIWGTFMLLVAVWVFTTRTITLLPSAALGTDLDLRLALQQTRGRFWFVIGAAFLPILPVLIVGRLLIAGTSGIVFIGLSLVLALILKALALVVSANLFRWLMENPK